MATSNRRASLGKAVSAVAARRNPTMGSKGPSGSYPALTGAAPSYSVKGNDSYFNSPDGLPDRAGKIGAFKQNVWNTQVAPANAAVDQAGQNYLNYGNASYVANPNNPDGQNPMGQDRRIAFQDQKIGNLNTSYANYLKAVKKQQDAYNKGGFGEITAGYGAPIGWGK